MFDRTDIIVGLEIGTAKACAVVAELTDDGNLSVVGIGQAPTRGAVRKGEIIHTQRAEDAVRETLARAEESANVEIGSVYLGVTGSHIKTFNNRGVHPIATVDREIDADDIQKVVTQAQPKLPAGEEVLHTIRQHFRVDGQGGVESPVGRFAQRLEVDVHVVCGQNTRLQNPVRVVKGLGIEVDDIAFTGRAGALAAVTPHLGEQGVLLVDLGAGTTEYAAYLNGSLRHSGVLAVGGEHVTNDIAVGLKLSQQRAEKLKLEFGSAVPNPRLGARTVNFSSDVGLDDKTVSVGHLHQIMHARLDELFGLIRNDLNTQNLLSRLQGGVVLAGGGSRVPQLELLAHSIFELDVMGSGSLNESGPQNILEQPEYTVAVGLVKFGAKQVAQQRNQRSGLFGWLAGS